MSKGKGYHHGDLRKALVEAGIDILEQAGVHALTLRAVAARAGVSHAAPHHHFPSLNALLTAIAAIAFTRLSEALAAECARCEQTPLAQIRAHGRAYLAFARSHPGLFRLMFTSTRLAWHDETLRSAARDAYGRLETVARPVADALGAEGETERAEIEQLLWAVAHGYAHLDIEQMVPKPGQPKRTEIPDIAGFLLAGEPARRRGRK